MVVERFRQGLTKGMQSIVPSDRRGVEGARQGSNCEYEKMFDSVPTKCVCCINN